MASSQCHLMPLFWFHLLLTCPPPSISLLCPSPIRHPPLSKDPRPISPFSYGKDRRGPCWFLAELHSEVESLLCSGASWLCHYFRWSSGWASDSWHSHSYTWGWGCHYLIIRHFFILLYLHIILVEICLCFDALYSGIWCITWSYLILYFLRLIYRHHVFYYT